MLKDSLNYINNLTYINKFKKINKINFSANKQSKNIILLEFNTNNLSIISYSFFANFLRKKHNAKIISYLFSFKQSFFEKIKIYLLSKINYRYFGIYSSFGTQSYFINNVINKSSLELIFKKHFAKINSKEDILYLKINDILIGDILYDSYLRIHNYSTIDINDQKFLNFAKKFIGIFLFWQDYIKKNRNKIKAVIVSHCVYFAAIPLRVCLNYNINSYQVNGQSIYKLNKKEMFAYKEFKIYPKLFQSLNYKNKNKYLTNSKKRLELRFQGKIGVDMKYSTKSAYGDFKKKRLIKKSKKIKILIAAHCFSDSPHSYGYNIFSDFHDWIETLGKVSQLSDYDWYVKTHPDYIISSKLTLKKIIEKYPKIVLLPSDTSHNQIIKEGINVVLTCYGTIAHEYAARNILVINASQNNPHIAYDFNINPKSRREYIKILKNLKKIKFKINKKKVYEFYYMRYLHNVNNWLLEDYKLLQNKIGYKSFSKPLIYKYWLESYNKIKQKRINKTIANFINSNEYFLQPKHLK